MPPRSRLRIEFPSIVESVRVRLERERLDVRRFLPPPWYEVLRPEDLLHFRVELKDLVPGADGRWQPKASASSGLVIFHLQPQHLLEYAPLEIGGWVPTSVATVLARPSRVVIEIPAGDGVTLTTRGLLEALAAHDMRLNAAARGEGPSAMRSPPGLRVDLAQPRIPTGPIADLIRPRTAEESARFGRIMRSLTARTRDAGAMMVDAMRALRPGEAAELATTTGVVDAARRRIEELLRVQRDGRPGAPDADETQLEIPFRLLLSPTPGSRWTHRTTRPVASAARRHELWHTRLAVIADGARDESVANPSRQARAVWTRDPGFTGTIRPPVRPEDWEPATTMPLHGLPISRDEREKIVAATSDERYPATRPVHVRRWMLSSQGGWIDLRGDWKDHGTGLIGWEHRATLGRDQFVRIEQLGWLWPFGNAASLVKISERKLDPRAPAKAFLWQRTFIRVLEPYRQWQGRTPAEERGKPFHSIEIKLRETPDVGLWNEALVAVPANSGGGARVPFVMELGTARAFRFPVSAVDRDNAIVTFDTPMVFVLQDGALPPPAPPPPPPSPAELDAMRALFVLLGDDRLARLRGQRVALAPASDDTERPGDTRLETAWLDLTAVLEAGARPRAMPQLVKAAVVIEAVRALTGSSAPVEVTHHAHYLQKGFGAAAGNPAELFLALPDAPQTEFSKGTDKVGGFLSPELAMTALSRVQGPVAGDADIINAGSGTFDPSDFFGALLDQAKLFGTFSLAEIIPKGLLSDAPKFITQALDLVQTVVAEVRRWEQLAHQIWEQVKSALAALGDAALTAAAALADPLKALELLVQHVWSAQGGRAAVESALTGAGAPTGVVAALPASFTVAGWTTFLEQCVKLAVGALAAAVDALIGKLTAWLSGVLAPVIGTVTAAVKAAVDLMTQLWSAWLRARAMVDTITALPSALAGDNPGAAITAIGGLLGGLAGSLAGVSGAVGGALAGVADLALRVRQEIEARIAQVKALFDEISTTFNETLRPALQAFVAAQDLVKNQLVRYSWSTKLDPWGLPGEPPIFKPTGQLTLAGELRGKEFKGKPAGVDLSAKIGAFELDLIAPLTFIGLKFDHISFDLRAGKKPELDVKFDGFEFKGPLAFVENLRKIIPLDGSAIPPALSISPQGIDASFSLALPTVAIGVFSLSNISLSAGFSIPFLGALPLGVGFAFCSRENPFNLTVSLLGGGGFFGIRINPKGVESMEAALEFGACLAIDLGVASGSVSIMAGVYFKMEGSAVTLTGYLRLRGEVDVLGLISASIELYMSLTYESSSGKVIGKASLEIGVKVLFLSFGVTVSMEKRFAGSSGDPTFLEVMAPDATQPTDPWDEYLDAFAA